MNALFARFYFGCCCARWKFHDFGCDYCLFSVFGILSFCEWKVLLYSVFYATNDWLLYRPDSLSSRYHSAQWDSGRKALFWLDNPQPRSLIIEKPSWQCEPSFDRIHPLFQTICRTKPNKSHRKCVSWLSTANACDRVLEQSCLLQLTNY